VVVSDGMRYYIFTENERKLIKAYIEGGETSDAFWVLLNRINKHYNVLNEDLSLIQKVMGKRNIIDR
jgi:hypothetical protein